VATLATDSTSARKGVGPAPVSAHPAFPAIVALWFAALLGLGSLILPLVLLERLSTVTGLASLVPSMAPPLGFTARASIALAAAVSGAALGLVLARQVARGQAPQARQRFGDVAHKLKPISAHEELGEEGLGADPPRPAGQKRRSLAIAEDSRPSEYLQAAPLPGYGHHAHATPDKVEALELADYVEPEEPDQAQENQEPSMTDARNFDPPSDDRPDDDERPEFMRSTSSASLPQAFDPMAQVEVEDEDEYEDEDERGAVDALPFAAPSLRRAQAVAAEAEDFDEDIDEPSAAGFSELRIPRAFEPEAAAPRLAAVATDETDCRDSAGENRPLEDLGLVQLATRLGSAIERRRALLAAQASSRPAGNASLAETNEDFDAAAAEDAARARADFFGAAKASQPEPFAPDGQGGNAPLPAPFASPLREIDLDEHDEADDDSLAASFSLPLRKRHEGGPVQRPAPVRVTFEEEEAEQEFGDEEEYSSLLAMKNPFANKSQFVRVEEPEPDEDEIEAAVTFPERKQEEPAAGARPFDPPGGVPRSKAQGSQRNHGEAERELRAALETLQRMSGTA
jgi:hypothetical protein